MVNGPRYLGAQGVGGACHAVGGKCLEGFLKKVPLRQGFGRCIGICEKWISISEDLEPVCVGIDIDAEPGKINIGRALHQSE